MDVTTAILFTVTCDKSMSVGTLTTHWQVCYWNAYENQRAPKMHSVCVSRWHGEDWEQFSWSHSALPNSELALLRPQDKNYWLNFFFTYFMYSRTLLARNHAWTVTAAKYSFSLWASDSLGGKKKKTMDEIIKRKYLSSVNIYYIY